MHGVWRTAQPTERALTADRCLWVSVQRTRLSNSCQQQDFVLAREFLVFRCLWSYPLSRRTCFHSLYCLMLFQRSYVFPNPTGFEGNRCHGNSHLHCFHPKTIAHSTANVYRSCKWKWKQTSFITVLVGYIHVAVFSVNHGGLYQGCYVAASTD